MGLLLISIMVSWWFKNHSIRYLHETGSFPLHLHKASFISRVNLFIATNIFFSNTGVSLLIGMVAGLLIWLNSYYKGVKGDHQYQCNVTYRDEWYLSHINMTSRENAPSLEQEVCSM